MSAITVTLMRALDFIARKHRDQRRKGVAAEPYINHLAEVALLVADATRGKDHLAVLGALLHDTIEDTATTKEDLTIRVRGEGRRTGDGSHRRQGPAQEKRQQSPVETAPHKSRRAKLIEIADKTSNLRSIIESSPVDWDTTRRREYFEWAAKVVAGAAAPTRSWRPVRQVYHQGRRLLG